MSINEGLGTAINIRVMERCDWIHLRRKKKYDVNEQDEIEMIRHRHKILERHNFFPAILLWITVAGKAWIAYH